jgi:hypothetical protein
VKEPGETFLSATLVRTYTRGRSWKSRSFKWADVSEGPEGKVEEASPERCKKVERLVEVLTTGCDRWRS